MLRRTAKVSFCVMGHLMYRVALLLGLLMAVYLLAIGPLCWIERHTGYADGATEFLYTPIDQLPKSFQRAVDAYAALWVPLRGHPAVPLPSTK
jgi:hypothetical protein